MAEHSVERRHTGSTPTGTHSNEVAYLPLSSPPRNHGHTTAAWTLVGLVVVGFTISALAVTFAVVWLFWAGLGVCLLGIVVGKALQAMGHGQGGAATLAKQSGSGH